MAMGLLPESFSSVLGLISICSWLGAQFPQIIVNYRYSSVQGLSLPFLIQWLLGDSTNLIGAILTNQLPFQIYLAVYFCMVDVALISQYMYYSKINPGPPLPPLDYDHDQYRSASIDRYPYFYQQVTTPPLSPQLNTNRSRAHSIANGHTQQNIRDSSLAPKYRPHYGGRDLSIVTIHGQHAPLHRSERAMAADEHHHNQYDTEYPQQESPQDVMSSSVESGQQRGPERGRRISRTIDPSIEQQQQQHTSLPSIHRTSSASSTTSNRRQPSIAFFALFTFSSLSFLSNRIVSLPYSSPLSPSSSPTSPSSLTTLYDPSMISIADKHHSNLDTMRLIGKTSAWICTCFYVTSRMPQIWKNFRRQSVEGLSMLLFIMAFLGNFFYCLSIFTSPRFRESNDFVIESIPFIIGAGGTLVFDTTIVFQSFLYNPNKKHRGSSHHHHGHHHNHNNNNNQHHHQHHHSHHHQDNECTIDATNKVRHGQQQHENQSNNDYFDYRYDPENNDNNNTGSLAQESTPLLSDLHNVNHPSSRSVGGYFRSLRSKYFGGRHPETVSSNYGNSSTSDGAGGDHYGSGNIHTESSTSSSTSTFSIITRSRSIAIDRSPPSTIEEEEVGYGSYKTITALQQSDSSRPLS